MTKPFKWLLIGAAVFTRTVHLGLVQSVSVRVGCTCGVYCEIGKLGTASELTIMYIMRLIICCKQDIIMTEMIINASDRF